MQGIKLRPKTVQIWTDSDFFRGEIGVSRWTGTCGGASGPSPTSSSGSTCTRIGCVHHEPKYQPECVQYAARYQSYNPSAHTLYVTAPQRVSSGLHATSRPLPLLHAQTGVAKSTPSTFTAMYFPGHASKPSVTNTHAPRYKPYNSPAQRYCTPPPYKASG